jgi:WD40 repeat protein
MNYKAFISYSHSADDKLAPALQSALHRFAKPFYRLRAIRVFRDKTSLHLTPELWPLIQQALATSEYFLLLASPDAAKSHWVQNEVAEWLKLNGGAEKLLLVLTDGEMIWDDAANDFNWERTDALPPNLRNVFHKEPLYSDLRWARKATDLSLRNPQFLDEIGSLGATLHGRPKDEMIGDDVRQHRLFKMITASALVLLLALTAAASSTALYAVKQRNEARRQTVEAEHQRLSALQSAERERKAAESERIERDKAERERQKAEQATRNETAAKNQAEERRREAERQRQLADERRIEAERERNLANARELAASAESQLNTDPELSLLLSLKAHERTPTAEADSALRHSLFRSRVRATFTTLNWYQTVYSPDGRWLILVSSVAQVIEPGTWRVVAELKGPGRWNSCRGVSFSRDGKSVLTITYNLDDQRSTLRLWEAGSWRVVAELPVADHDELASALLSPDARFVATWSSLAKGAYVWNLSTGKSVRLGGKDSRAEEAAFSPDSRTVVLAGADSQNKRGAAQAWEVATGRMLYEFECPGIWHGGLSFSPDGKYLALICKDELPRVVEAATGKTVVELNQGAPVHTSVTFSPDGNFLVTPGNDHTIRVWTTGAWQPAAVLRGHSGRVESLKFSSDGSLLVSSSDDGTARLWEAGTWRSLSALLRHTMPIYDLAVSPDGRYVVTTAKDSRARIWEVDPGAGDDVTQIDGSTENGLADALPTVYSADGKLLAVRSAANIVEIREAASLRKIAELGRGNFLGFSPDGKYAFKTGFKPYVRGAKFDAEMWNTQTWEKAADLPDHSDVIRGIAFSPDGRLVATVGGELHVWETGTGRSIIVLNDPAWRAVFSPDGKWLATVSPEKTPRVWEVGTWRAAGELRGHTAWVRAISFSRDGSRLVTAGEDNTARVWETGTWRALVVLEGHTDRVDDVSISPNGRYVLTASWDKTGRLWDVETGKVVAVLDGHSSFVNSARFSPDGRLIATAGDRTVRIWDGATGRSVIVLSVFTPGLDPFGSERAVRAASFSPGGKSLLVSGSDGTTRIYAWETFAPLPDLLALGRTRVTRDLTADEKRKYLHEVIENKEPPGRQQ